MVTGQIFISIYTLASYVDGGGKHVAPIDVLLINKYADWIYQGEDMLE